MRSFQRNTLLAVVLLILFCFTCPAFAANDSLQVYVDGKATNIEAKSTGNLVFLPVRDMASTFDATLA
ncbi:MAG: hypothetical protein IKZ26_00900, partial [Peptococcaceae bacterium]|nr:hypothetical protein [Peptococcaceae bacterium]